MRLPAELRDEIYHFVALNDCFVFADHVHRPSLLQACRQLREEYACVFFADGLVAFDEYHLETDAWSVVLGKTAKMDVFARSLFVDMAGLVNSLAGAQRYCQKRCERTASPHVKRRRHGIMTLSINGSPRYWTWFAAG